jgi:hypothetical protein
VFNDGMQAENDTPQGDEANPVPTLRIRKDYDPYSEETKERRRKLFDAIERGRTPETDAAMNKFADRFLGRFRNE